MKKFIIITALLIGSLGFSQKQKDTLTVISDLKDKVLVVLPGVNKTKVIEKMDSLYYANPMKNNELCIKVLVNGKLDFHRDYKRREKVEPEKVKK